ncbi:MAG: hypothetical protein KF726_28785 [Anaerolineae bacterium]|nr:hypothetical protein [Anaerolineae bacterium]
MTDLIIKEPLASRIRAVAEQQGRSVEDLLLEVVEKVEYSTRTVSRSSIRNIVERTELPSDDEAK